MTDQPKTANASEKVDILLRGGTVLTMNAARQVYAPGSVAIRGNAIVAVGPVDALDAAYVADQVVDCADQVIMPGLINTHTHMPMSLLRGLADDLRLDVWLHGYILPVEREFVNPEFAFLGTLLSCAEMLRGGTTCFADMYYHEEEVAWAAVQAGLRGVCGETIMKFPTPDAGSYEESLQYTADFLSHWQGHELIVAVPAPHSIYMCTPSILQETTALARKYDVPQLIHVSETSDEVENWVAATAMRPVRWLQDQGVLDSKVVAAHCVHVNSEEIRIMQAHRVGVAHNPTSNLKLASGVAPVAEMLEQHLSVGVGTDGCASNNDLDMFEETRLASLLPKGVTHSPVVVPAIEAVAMATIYGAQALHLGHLIGSVEVGKRADLIVVDMTRLHSVPPFDTTGRNIYSRLVYAAKACDVRDVLVNGRMVVRDRALLTVDERQVIEQANTVAQRINRFFVAREKSVQDKLLAIGGLEQQETFEVQVKGTLRDPQIFEQGLHHPDILITAHTSRDQYDTYFLFEDPAQGRLRYREDNVIQPDGTVHPIYNLTLTGPSREAEYEDSVVLSRSRYTAPATRSLRFYREYFQPAAEREIVKHRERFHIRYKGVDFAVNLDRIQQPPQKQPYVEIKSRTWSRQDAIRKAGLISELLHILGAEPEDILKQEYVDLL
ncbi:MAG: amidohydrolase family protein [Chloroflexi bacterium]|nr:amidohydrolase family protein [Chloroflexota bacterium]